MEAPQVLMEGPHGPDLGLAFVLLFLQINIEAPGQTGQTGQTARQVEQLTRRGEIETISHISKY